eukprot:gnl/TRDRNA2_/TRDRNA2_187295_c0_seq1.p1 gnl/TRDRNA2_/TRDRNA2_187295_c0~~gnl/TRDRNA2_/TRDRNA2_187295_c0_seq1.p1  ORF type:complete len:377 (+),score=73.89 gnl/TRDRNA2_/TRDRNA2_187295_c0_seq1:51-1181(+)
MASSGPMRPACPPALAAVVRLATVSLLCWFRPAAGLVKGLEVLDGSTFESFIARNDKVMVDFYDPAQEDWTLTATELSNAVRLMRENGCHVPIAKVDATKETELAKKFVPEGTYPQLVWFVHGEPTQYHRRLKSAVTILNFVLALDRDPIVKIEKESDANEYSPAILAKTTRKSPIYKALEVAAANHLDTVAVMFLESESETVSFLAKDKSPELYTGEADKEAVDKWIRMHLVKSEEKPWHNTEPGSPVVHVVGTTFEEIVLDKEKDVMILIFASWCGFCKRFHPTWEAFARKVATELNPNFVVAQMEGDRNSSPLPFDFSWHAYPTVFFVPAGATKPFLFSGNRTIEHLVEFANEHLKTPINLGGSGNPDEDTDL